jgi:hypothetical protein
MNANEKSKQEELREAWIESLLLTTTRPEDNRERIALVMEQIAEDSEAPRMVKPAPKQRTTLRWWTLAVAASFLLALFIVVDSGGTSGKAVAAVERSLNVAAELMTRKYLLRVEYRPAIGGTRKIDNQLYVQGKDRFALRHPGVLPGKSVWLGHDGVDSWVLPAFGPVLKGDNTFLSRWLRSREELNTPYLHITTMLTRMMSRGYQLETMSDEEIVMPDGLAVECQHIRALRKNADQLDGPDTIDLWASRESGTAVRLIARWELADGEIGRESVVLAFQHDEPSLEEEWFTAEAHYEGQRPIVRVDSQRTAEQQE